MTNDQQLLTRRMELLLILLTTALNNANKKFVVHRTRIIVCLLYNVFDVIPGKDLHFWSFLTICWSSTKSKEFCITSFTCTASEGGQSATIVNNSSPVKRLFTSLQARTNVLRSTVSYKNDVINNEHVHTHARICTHTRMHTHTCTHTHTHAHTQTSNSS